jgi:hypothetical protein
MQYDDEEEDTQVKKTIIPEHTILYMDCEIPKKTFELDSRLPTIEAMNTVNNIGGGNVKKERGDDKKIKEKILECKLY